MPDQIEKWRWWEEVIRNIVQLFVQPEMLGIMLIVVLPFPAALLWRNSAFGFPVRLLCACAAGFVLWAIAIVAIFMPRYRRR